MRQKKIWGVLTAALAAVAVGTCALSGAALETGSGELGELQAFLLGRTESGSQDLNADGITDGMDLAALRQKGNTGRLYRFHPDTGKASCG